MSSEERFDIYDDDGSPIGTASRKDVHRLGYWHHTFHCWLARRMPDGRTAVLFQRRAESKDTNPGCFDITVAGHLSAGETLQDAVREMDEEIGWSVPFERLVPFGTIRENASGELRGVPYIDREISHVFGCLTSHPLNRFKLQEEEVAGIYECDAERLIDLMEGRIAAAQADGFRLGKIGLSESSATLRVSDFVPRDLSYYVDVFRFLLSLTERGEIDSFDKP
ncbi:NUDIX domain-containing protein [Cohnella faecalis]|uniref:NUDIX domain-containing protein n=1 Tax=Cohnella faecalis TaxID=2315694 RepID=A0A398CJB2_9BACL|nr:NUDIX domain-containing protein [Cohnella faecalis]RIE02212.1 NUDIX domain-containing protein [Cohnella faecalis]